MHRLLVLAIAGWVLPALAQPNGTAEANPAAEPRGALAGTVDLEADKPTSGRKKDQPAAVVEVVQELDGWTTDPRGSSAARRTTTGERGGFRIDGLLPGFYTLKVEAGDLRLLRRNVKVEAGRETLLPEKLVPTPPIQLAVRVAPAFDPWQRPWKIRLVADRPLGRLLQVLAEGPSDDTGLATFSVAEEGQASAQVLDGDGRVWLDLPVEIYPGRPEVFASIDLVRIDGRLSHGNKSLEAELSFGSTQGQHDIRMLSDASGRFTGYLPREGFWPVEVLWPDGGEANAQRLPDVEIRRRPGKTSAEVEIRVPPTELLGTALVHGKPVENAGITVERELDAAERRPGQPRMVREAILLTDAEGRFRLRGLESGELWLEAKKDRLSSGRVCLRLEESSWPKEVVLELEEKAAIRGMVTLGTRPVGGALILALAAGDDPGFGPAYAEVATDSAGYFELLVPARANRIDLVAAGASAGVEMTRLHKAAGQWPSPLLALAEDSGTLRSRILPAPAGENFTTGLIFRRNGATLRWNAMFRALQALGKLELASGEAILHGLAPGLWESCLESDTSTCQAGNLPPRGELELASPRGGGKSE